MTAGLAARPPRSAASGCRRCAIGCSPSTRPDRRVPAPRTARGSPPVLTDAQRQALGWIVETGQIPAEHGVVRWRLIDLVQWVFDEFRLSISKQTFSGELGALGFRKLSARPLHHAQDAEALATFKKTAPPAWRRSPRAMRQASR